jgi:hypothetical protein
VTSLPDISDNAAWREAPARLSVLIPFHLDDPRPLLVTLDALARGAGGGVELIVLDDGAAAPDLTREVRALMRAFKTPSRLISNPCNEGRARGRNRLAAAARAAHLLLLDSDMAPEAGDFLKTYLACCARNEPLVFGGFSVERAPRRRETDLHRRLQAMGECLPAAKRQEDPCKYVCASNLLVRRDVLEAEPFDPGFTGWGWEDVEWGLRAGRRFGVVHIDNPATHLGLDGTDVLLAKYEQSAANFARLLKLHPAETQRFPLHRWALRLRRLPWRNGLRGLLRGAALAPILPLRARALALKTYRAALYAEVIAPPRAFRTATA